MDPSSSEEGGTGAPPAAPADEAADRWWARLRGALGLLVLLALLVHPTQVTVRQWAEALARTAGAGHRLAALVPAVRVTMSDALFIGVFALWALGGLASGRLVGRLRRYPPALLALLGCAAVSMVPFLKPADPLAPRSLAYGAALKEFAQLCAFFVCAYVVLADYMRDARWRRRVAVVFLAACALAIAWGVEEYVRLRPEAGAAGPHTILSPADVDGTFGFRTGSFGPGGRGPTASNRNVLGAWVSVVVPLLWGVALCVRSVPGRLAAGLAAAAGLLLLLHGGLWLATVAALLLIGYLAGPRSFAVTAVGLFVFWALVFHFAPQKHGAVLLDSLMLRRERDRFQTLTLYGPEPGRAGPVPPAELSEEDGGVWQQKFTEWQPGLQALARSPLFGLGLGNYQRRINALYAPRPDALLNPGGVYRMPKPAANLMERGGNSFYLVWLVETGLAGLFAVLWLLLFWFQSAGESYSGELGSLEEGLALGALGALVAVGGGMAFTNYLVRGVGVAVVFALASASGLREASAGSPEA
jgi:hypothetical protein